MQVINLPINSEEIIKDIVTQEKIEGAIKPTNPKVIEIINYIEKNYPNTDIGNTYIVVSVPKQELYFIKNNNITTYPVSTSRFGIGNIMDSYQTPLGLHTIKSKLGNNSQIGTIIKSGIVTKQISSITTEPVSTDTDLLITRVIQLSGEEFGINKGGNVDSLARGIMIHGTPEEGLIGTPVSHGCIRMLNKDIIELFNNVSIKTKVIIENNF